MLLVSSINTKLTSNIYSCMWSAILTIINHNKKGSFLFL